MSAFKHYRQKNEEGSDAFLLFRVHLETHDIRSGFKGSSSGLFAAPLLTEDDLDWTHDMVDRVEEEELEEIPAPDDLEWPRLADTKIIRYFAHHHRIPIWRNYDLSLYGLPGEEKEELIQRSIDSLSDEWQAEMSTVRDVFLRRFLEIEQKKLDEIEEDDWTPEAAERRIMQIREIFSRIREQFADCFVNQDLALLKKEDLDWPRIEDLDYTERLENLRAEFVESFNAINKRLRKKATRVERHEVPISYSDVEITTRAFLWRKSPASSQGIMPTE